MKLDEIMEQFQKKLNEIEKTGTEITPAIRRKELRICSKKS